MAPVDLRLAASLADGTHIRNRPNSTVENTQTNTQGRLNQWAHWARARGPGFFSFFWGGATGCGEIIFKTNYLITFAKINCKRNPVNTF